jgi:hypothetical protein
VAPGPHHPDLREGEGRWQVRTAQREEAVKHFTQHSLLIPTGVGRLFLFTALKSQ